MRGKNLLFCVLLALVALAVIAADCAPKQLIDDLNCIGPQASGPFYDGLHRGKPSPTPCPTRAPQQQNFAKPASELQVFILATTLGKLPGIYAVTQRRELLPQAA